MFFCVFSAIQPIPFEVDVAVLASNYTDIIGSMVYYGAPIEAAVEDINAEFNGTLKLSVKFISEKDLPCSRFMDNLENLYAQWNYKQRRPAKEVLSFVTSPGSLKDLTDNTSWRGILKVTAAHFY